MSKKKIDLTPGKLYEFVGKDISDNVVGKYFVQHMVPNNKELRGFDVDWIGLEAGSKLVFIKKVKIKMSLFRKTYLNQFLLGDQVLYFTDDWLDEEAYEYGHLTSYENV